MIKKGINIRGRQYNRKYTVFKTVIEEDIGIAACNHGPDTEVSKRPNRMLARRSAAKVLPRQKHPPFTIGFPIQNKV